MTPQEAAIVRAAEALVDLPGGQRNTKYFRRLLLDLASKVNDRRISKMEEPFFKVQYLGTFAQNHNDLGLCGRCGAPYGDDKDCNC